MKRSVIELEGMEFYSFHGCYREEQMVGNRFLVDLTFETSAEKCAHSDSIEDAVSYLEVYQLVAKEMAIPSHLLEHVAKRIIDAVVANFASNIYHIKVKVSKCNPPLGGYLDKVSVTLER